MHLIFMNFASSIKSRNFEKSLYFICSPGSCLH